MLSLLTLANGAVHPSNSWVLVGDRAMEAAEGIAFAA